MDLYTYQEHTERKYSKKNIQKVIMEEINSSKEVCLKVNQCISLVNDYMFKEYWESKNIRIQHLMNIDIEVVITDILCVIMPEDGTQLYTSVVGQIAPRLKYDNLLDGLKTAAELVAVLEPAGLYQILRAQATKSGMMEVYGSYSLKPKTKKYIEETMFLPPMVTEPKIVDEYNHITHLTHEEDCLVLGHSAGKGNKELAYDVLNKLNQTALSLNVQLLTELSETIPEDLATKEAEDQLNRMVHKSYAVYKDLIQTGNKFWLTHKYDSRQRGYCQGYHVSYQGNAFKKAIVQLNHKELIEG